MPLINNAFNGKLNFDDDDYRIINGDYTDALNITKDAENPGQDKVVSNILGNSLLSYTLPFGFNKVIGFYPDKTRNRAYYFIWNNGGYHSILYLNYNTDTVEKLFVSKTDSNGIDILKFNPSYKILSINIIYRDESEGDLLFFNDGLNEPRYINTIANFGTSWKEEYLSVAKAPPVMPIKAVYENDNSYSTITTTYLNSYINPYDNYFPTGAGSIVFSFGANSYFTLEDDGTSIKYIGVSGFSKNLNLNINLYSISNGYIIRIFKNGILIDESDNIYSTNYSVTLSTILNTNDKINITLQNIYGSILTTINGNISFTSITTLLKAKVSVNNLRNSLFQFRYRYIYDDFQKSVWSSASIIPLPYQSSLQLTEDIFTNNARISLSFSTGNPQVSGIELAFRKFSNNFTSDWQLITKLSKSLLNIEDNSIYNYKFYNDGIYNQIDILDTEKLQDYVPQKANAGELVNGNTLVYGGITEGYDLINSQISVTTDLLSDNFYYDYNGFLFFASIYDGDSGVQGTTMKIYVYGTGTNGTDSEVFELNNAKAKFYINAVNNSNVSIGLDESDNFINSTDTVLVSTLLGNISSVLITKGWTFSSLNSNILTMTYPTNVKLYSSGIKLYTGTLNNNTTSFANVFEGSYQVGIMYFDSKGRTNGVISNVGASYNTTKNNPESPVNYCTPIISISNTPPDWAFYYQLVRSNNTTYNKRLFWISNSAYSSVNTSNAIDNESSKYVYIGIDNLDYYNQQIKATEGVVYYNFTQGDRIKFISKYNFSLSESQLSNDKLDYEILGVEVNPNIDGITKNGRFIKIYYPTNDISAEFKFDGTSSFQNYKILLYNYSQQTNVKNKLFFEFGKCFGIGDAGLSTRYHIGLNQTQSSSNPVGVPAKIQITNGDLFFRKRKIPINDIYSFQGKQDANDLKTTLIIDVPTIIENDFYKIQSQARHEVFENISSYPIYSDNDQFIYNKSANSIDVDLKTIFQFYDATNTNQIYFKAMVITETDKKIIPLTNIVNTLPANISNGILSESKLDTKITMPPSSKLYIYIDSIRETGSPTTEIMGFNLDVTILKANPIIEIIETSFSDVYNIVTNSNGRPSVIDENAKKTYFPTLVRFGQSYQADTNINGTNRFYYENFDTYDRGFGDIMRLHVRDRYMKVYQKYKIGNVPVLTQIVKDVQGNPLQANSDQLINKIQYYSGDYGIGDAATSLAWNNFADYFIDNYRGVVCRLSQDGITPISITEKMNSFFVKNLPPYRQDLNNGFAALEMVYLGNPCIYGVFDAYTNKYIIAMEEINRFSENGDLLYHQDPKTICFDEVGNGFESFYSYYPEFMGSLNVTLFTFKDGNIWKHKSQTYCNFYNNQSDAYIQTIFNTNSLDKKTFISIMETGNTIWNCPEIYTQMMSYGTQKQESELIDADFEILESEYHASFLRDSNSQGGILNGDALKGGYIAIKFQKDNANTFVFLNSATVKYINSPLNNR